MWGPPQGNGWPQYNGPPPPYYQQPQYQQGPPQGDPRGGYGGPPPQYGMPPPQYGQPPGINYGLPQGGRPPAKKALICGSNYKGSDCALGGCVNDANCMRYLLTTKFGFEERDIRFLTDDQSNPGAWPTRHNMLEGFRWLTAGAQPGDSLFFHYSGHGSQTADRSGDEIDNMNETLCPCDFRSAGMIVDDDLNRVLINPLPPGSRLHCVIDACHSGSVMDLPFSASFHRGQPNWKNEYSHPTSVYKGTAGGRAYQFGAAADDQTAADTNKLSGNVSTGAATYSFIQAIEKCGTHVSYGQLLHEMHVTLKSMNDLEGTNLLAPGGSGGGSLSSLLSGGGGKGGLMGGLLSAGMDMLGSRGGGSFDFGGALGSIMNASNSGGWHKQTPVLSCNEPFDFNEPLSLL